MNENSGDKILTVATKTLSLKRPVEQGTVRQSFSHGRTKQVVVEKVKRRPGPGAETATREIAAVQQVPLALKPAAAPAALAPAAAAAAPAKAPPPRSMGGVVLRTLTEEEREARAKALVGA